MRVAASGRRCIFSLSHSRIFLHSIQIQPGFVFFSSLGMDVRACTGWPDIPSSEVARTTASDVLIKGGTGPAVKLNQYSPICKKKKDPHPFASLFCCCCMSLICDSTSPSLRTTRAFKNRTWGSSTSLRGQRWR